MTNLEWEDFEDDFEDFEDEQPTPRRNSDDAMKKVRRAERAKDKRIKELESELSTLRKVSRDSNIKSVLEQRGINPKIAALIPGTLEVGSNEFDSFLEDYADVFGGSPVNTGPAVDEADLATLRQIDAVTSTAVAPDRAEDILLRINQASSQEELLNLIYGSE